MKHLPKIIVTIFILSFAISCDNNSAKKQVNNAEDSLSAIKADQVPIDSLKWTINGIKVYAMDIKSSQSDASITLSQPINNPRMTDETTFHFEINNFKLGVVSNLPTDYQGIFNDTKGQYIAFILNNGEIEKVRQDSFQTQLFPGNNVVAAFLCNSFGVSLKNKSGLLLENFRIGNSPVSFNEKGQHLFYNMPQGFYPVANSNKIILDFYLVNTLLSKNGDKVRATINGVEFLLPKWCPYIIQGLKPGKNTIRLELLDKNGNLIPGPFNDSGVRTITIGENKHIS